MYRHLGEAQRPGSAVAREQRKNMTTEENAESPESRASAGTSCWAFRLLPIVARVIGPLTRICGIYPSIEFTVDRLDHQSCWTDWSDGFGSFCWAAEHLAESEQRYPDRRFRITCKLVFDAYAVR